MHERLVGSANENYVEIEGNEVKALIDTGSMITTLSQEFYETMENKPELKSLDEFDLNVTGANGVEIPYSGYIEASVRIPNTDMEPLLIPILIVSSTDYNKEVPSIVGMKVIREVSDLLRDGNVGDIPKEWKLAFDAANIAQIGVVKTTKDITLQPMEVRTITGLVRKNKEVESVVTEDLENRQAYYLPKSSYTR